MLFRQMAVVAALILFCAGTPGKAQEVSAEYSRDVSTLLKMTNATQIGAQVAENVMRDIVKQMTKKGSCLAESPSEKFMSYPSALA